MPRGLKRKCTEELRPRRKCATPTARQTYMQEGISATKAEMKAQSVHGNDPGLLPSE